MNLFSLHPGQRARLVGMASLLLLTSPIVSAQMGGVNSLPGRSTLPFSGAALTTLHIVDKAGVAQTNVPVTFGQVFIQGAFPSGSGLSATYNGQALPVQVNVKATHADGSVRHAVISAILPQLNAGQKLPLALTAAAPVPPTVIVTPGQVVGGRDTTVNLNIGGQTYSASAYHHLKLGKYTTWLSGSVANEWHVSAPFTNAAGVEHPHLSARFAVRHYKGGRIRSDVTIENNWAYEPNPKNVVYDAEVLVSNQRVYSKAGLTHYHHARWRKLFWDGGEPRLHVEHNRANLIASRAVPNYDQSITVSPTALTQWKTSWDSANTGPMGMAMLEHAMGGTGGHPEIGLHHAWGAAYILSQDARAKEITVGLSDLSGSWPIHYRDRNTDQPVSIMQYPYVSTRISSTDSFNRATGKHEYLPGCAPADQCAVPYSAKTSHHPSLAFLPYLVTGDAYHLDELLFWANWNLLHLNPHYRGLAQGLIVRDQVRSQAWALRTLGQAAYITPDSHPLKTYFKQIVDNNLDLYNKTYTSSGTNQLGFIDNTLNGGAVIYNVVGPNTGVAAWMDDFFTSAVGHLFELGFSKAKPILDWKARFPVGRMMAPDFCWVDGSVYSVMVRPSETAPFYPTFADAYKATMRTSTGAPLVNSTGQRYLDQPCGSQSQADWRTQLDKDKGVRRSAWIAGEMVGYSKDALGYPSNMQPALAAAASTGIPNASAAWTRFIGRSVKPDYSAQPQFAIMPR